MYYFPPHHTISMLPHGTTFENLKIQIWRNMEENANKMSQMNQLSLHSHRKIKP